MEEMEARVRILRAEAVWRMWRVAWAWEADGRCERAGMVRELRV